jgi:bifunctional non-homologous end joining protein LigD
VDRRITPGKGIAMLRETCRERGEASSASGSIPLCRRAQRGMGQDQVRDAQEFVIGGFTEPQRSAVGLGRLLVGYYEGRQVPLRGKVGTGFNTELLLDLRKRLDRIEQPQSPFAIGKPPRGEHVHWVKPRLVGEFGFAEWTQNDLLRQPRFEGLRMDKKPTLVRRERAKMVSI